MTLPKASLLQKRLAEVLGMAEAFLLMVTGRASSLMTLNEALRKEVAERKQAEQALRESEERLRLAQQVACIGTFECEVQTGVNRWTPELEAMYGLPRGSFAGTQEAWEKLLHPEDRLEAVGRVQEAMGKGGFQGEWRVIRPDGTLRWVAGRAWVFKDESGKPVRLLGVNIDITERKAAEQEVRKLNQELELRIVERTAELACANASLARSNAELSQFAYVASHDLQEPLRTVTSFVQLLEKRYKGQLDAKGEQYIRYVVDGTARMHQLVKDLLTYAKAGAGQEAFTLVDCQAVLTQVLTNLEASIEESRARIDSGPLPEVMGDRLQLTQLFQNLIGNAIKYRSDQPPEVRVMATRKDAEWEFSIRDNGIGIEPQYGEHIFLIFKRLHTRSEYSGTGVGLALCKKIVEGHGGRIWVDSQVGHGSTFYFAIPADQEDQKEEAYGGATA